MTKKLRFREVLGLAKAAQLSERDSKQLKHLLGPPDISRDQEARGAAGGGAGVLVGAVCRWEPRPPQGAQPQAPFGQTWPRAVFLARGCAAEARAGAGAVLRGRPGIGAGSPRRHRETRAAAAWDPCREPWSSSTMCCPPTPGWASR